MWFVLLHVYKIHTWSIVFSATLTRTLSNRGLFHLTNFVNNHLTCTHCHRLCFVCWWVPQPKFGHCWGSGTTSKLQVLSGKSLFCSTSNTLISNELHVYNHYQEVCLNIQANICSVCFATFFCIYSSELEIDECVHSCFLQIKINFTVLQFQS